MNKNIIIPFSKTEKSIWISCLILFFSIILYSFFAEKTINNGAGYDGLFYRDLVKNFPAMLAESFSSYKATRILPFAFCYAILKFFQIEVTDTIVLNTVWLIAFLLLTVAVFYYHKLAEFCNWSLSLKITGFILLFFQFGILKYYGYYPLLTDHFIFSISIITAYYFTTKNLPILVLLGMIASFTWPSSLLIYCLLLMNTSIKEEQSIQFSKWQTRLFELVKIGFAFIPPILFVYFIRRYNLWVGRSFLHADWIFAMFRPYNFSVAVLSVAATCVYYYLIIKPVTLPFIFNFLKSFFQITVKQIISIVILVGLVLSIKYFLTRGNQEIPFPTIEDVFRELMFKPAVAPFNFLVYHFWFLGFLVLFVVHEYRYFFNETVKLGNGYVLLIFYALIFVTGAQSRQLINMMPFFLLPVIHMIRNRGEIKVQALILLGILALLVSRFWFPIELNEHYMKEGDTAAEKYSMFIGPWITDQFYIVLGIIGFVIYFIWRQYIWKPIS
jgi:hypothetical protein